MRITNNMVTNGILNELQQLQNQQSSLQTEVSTGLAVTQPSDNPTVYGQVVGLQYENDQLAQFNANASQALSIANASYGGLDSLQQIYDRASQLGTEGSGSLGTGASRDYSSELDQLIQQAVQVANSQQSGSYIYGGTAVGTAPFTTATDPATGQISGVTYVGNFHQASIAVSTTSSVSPGTSGATNSGIAGFINGMIALRGALQSGDSGSIDTATSNLASSEDVITSAVAENGAVQARIQAEQTQLQARSAEIGTLISGDADTNLASTIVQLNQAQLAYQASLQTAASVMHLSLLNYVQLQ